jgi:riboflavin synthase
MFTGLIREMATVKRYASNILSLRAEYRPKIGDSVAVNGVCLTVIQLHPDGFDVELADETRAIIDESRLKGHVHIEPAMQMHDRFEGHVVQGHVDTIGTVAQITPRQNGTDFYFTVPPEHLRYIVPKGSITLDGISLTVNDVDQQGFHLMIIPHTLQNTLMRTYHIGTRVNIETDMFARYIAHLITHRPQQENGLSWGEVDALTMGY